MNDAIDELMEQIKPGEDSSLELAEYVNYPFMRLKKIINRRCANIP